MDQRIWYRGPAPRSPASPSPGAPPGQSAVSGSCWLAADSASVVTPESAGAGDVFKLSLRREKKKQGQQREEVAWAGPPGESRPAPAHPRPGPRSPTAWPPQGQAATQASSCGRGGLGQGHWVWETQGEVVPLSPSPWESEEVRQH